jgi:hypothetical protein
MDEEDRLRGGDLERCHDKALSLVEFLTRQQLVRLALCLLDKRGMGSMRQAV